MAPRTTGVPSNLVARQTFSRFTRGTYMRPHMSLVKPFLVLRRSGLITTSVESAITDSTITMWELSCVDSFICTAPSCTFIRALELTYNRVPALMSLGRQSSWNCAERPEGEVTSSQSFCRLRGGSPPASNKFLFTAMLRILLGVKAEKPLTLLKTSMFASETGPHALSTRSPQCVTHWLQ